MNIRNECCNFFIEPIKQAGCNVRSALRGRRVERFQQDAFAMLQRRRLSSVERVCAVAVAAILIVPIINTLVLTILRNNNSRFYYSPVRPNPVRPNSGSNNTSNSNATNSNRPSGSSNRPSNSGGGIVSGLGTFINNVTNAVRPGDGSANLSEVLRSLPPYVAPEAPQAAASDPTALHWVMAESNQIGLEQVTPEVMLDRKREALARLAVIERMVTSAPNALRDLTAHFSPNACILNFNLERLLQEYESERRPTELGRFMNWANVTGSRDTFMSVLRNFESNDGREDVQKRTVRKFLSQIASYFIQEGARITAAVPMNEASEAALKLQFNRVFDSIVDANNNCIDQTLSQIQTLILDVVAEGSSARPEGAIQTKLLSMAGLGLAKYRANLLKTILVHQNPQEHHMADLDRVVTQRVSDLLGMQGGIFTAGARFAGVVSGTDERVERAVTAFFEEGGAHQYKPMEYLLNELRTNIGEGPLRTLRNEICKWASNFYGLSDEYDEDGNEIVNLPNGSRAPNMSARMSAHPDQEYGRAHDGGDLTLPALMFLLEKTLLVQDR